MRPEDKRVFLQAARELGLWLLVRRTNRASLQYVGRSGYCPKPIDCKAKSAEFDVDRYRLAGLVVDPTLQPKAFSPGKLQKALQFWNDYGPAMLASGRYSVDQNPDQPTYGLVRLGTEFLHGDYDLYDIIDPEQAQRNLAAVESMLGQAHRRGPNFYRVQSFINQGIGVPMIQHGGEMQYTDHSDQSIDVFGPKGEDFTILNQFSVRAWYANEFQGRKALS